MGTHVRIKDFLKNKKIKKNKKNKKKEKAEENVSGAGRQNLMDVETVGMRERERENPE